MSTGFFMKIDKLVPKFILEKKRSKNGQNYLEVEKEI